MDGVCGIYGNDKDFIEKSFLALSALQHRGKESAGIAVGNDKEIYIYKGLGKINDIFDGGARKNLAGLESYAAICNVGYTKNEHPEKINSEPLEIHPKTNSPYKSVITLNGDMVDKEGLEKELEDEYDFNTNTYTEITGALFHKYLKQVGGNSELNHEKIFEAGKKLIDKLNGRATFAISMLIHDGKKTHLATLNDSGAFEPFCFGGVDNLFLASSESTSHRILAGNIEREFDGAEMTVSNSDGTEIRRLREETLMRDAFQAFYFGAPDSIFKGKTIYEIRRLVGFYHSGHEKPIKVDVIIYNPDSGIGVTYGIAERIFNDSGKWLLKPALYKRPQAVRTFQIKHKKKRFQEVNTKFGVIDYLVSEKRVVMGDDSVVKGSVSLGGANQMLKNAGVKWLSFWISYGPMIFPSFKEWPRGKECLEELAVQRAFRNDNVYDKSLEEIEEGVRKLMGIDDVRYNSIEIVKKYCGDASYQALDASYPISEKFWPDWLKIEVEKFHRYKEKV